jgi:sugar porter (SP) family MFS transporter
MKTNFRYLLSISFVTALGGLLFGFDISVISGTIPFIKEYFNLSESMKGWMVSSALLGCIVGAAFGGNLGDKYGRKKILFVTSILFGISAIGTGWSYSITEFIIYRIIGGIAVGGASVLAPVYIAEVSPAYIRGRMVSVNQLTIVIGISLAYYSNYFLLGIGEDAWRWMFAAEAVPALFFMSMLLIIPESPRWLVAKDKNEKASEILTKVAGADFADEELIRIKDSLKNKEKKIRLKSVFNKKYKFVLFIGIFLAVFQQWSGINVIFFYAPDIFAKANLGVDTALFQTTIIGVINIVFTLISMWLIDRIGRKILLLVGSAGMLLCYILIGYLFMSGNTDGWLIITVIVMTPAFFSVGLGATVWVVMSEIFPNKIRGIGMSVVTFSLWIASYLLTLTFPIFVEWFNTAYTFWIYAVICLIGIIVIGKYLPETKGISLEEMEKKLLS